MKKLAIALASAAALLAGPALAADLGMRPIAKAPAYVPAPAPYFNWTGFYIGGGVGGMWEETRGNFDPVAFPGFGFNTRRDTGVGGVHGGLQWQTGMFVFGAEAGWLGSWDNSFGTTLAVVDPTNCGFLVGQSCQSRINDIFYVGGKLGLAWDRFMVYGQGGYASANIESRGLTGAGVAFSTATRDHSGWYAGAGVDVMAWSLGGADVILGVDYKHFEFDDGNHDIAAPFAADSRRLRADADVFMGRVTFKFNPFRGPIAASY